MTDEQPRVEEQQVEQVEEPQAPAGDAPGTREAPAAPQPDAGGPGADVSGGDRLLRLAADFENYRKRAAREREEYVRLANERLLAELLPILDDLERALKSAEQHEEAQLEEGVRLVHRSLASVLRRNGVTEIDATARFDPHVHEALLQQPAVDKEPGDVVDVVQKGYRLGDRVVRPARVIVAE